MSAPRGLAARACLGASAGLAVAVWSTAASASDGDADLLGYYGGERTSAYVVGGIGAAAAAGGALLVTRQTDLARGLGWTWLVMGGLETAAAVGYAFQVGGEIDHYEALLAREPARYRAEEIDHIRGTASRFVFYRITELTLLLGGSAAATYGFASGSDSWKGIGIGVATLALPVAVIDTINDARAHRYLRTLETGVLTVGAAPTDHGFALSLGGRF